jgi:hypothetical protein
VGACGGIADIGGSPDSGAEAGLKDVSAVETSTPAPDAASCSQPGPFSTAAYAGGCSSDSDCISETAFQDCAGILESCGCPGNAINKANKSQYDSDVAAYRSACAAVCNSCTLGCAACPSNPGCAPGCSGGCAVIMPRCCNNTCVGTTDGTCPSSTLSPGTGTLSGPSAFPVAWAWMNPSSGEATGCGGSNAIPGGGYASTVIDLFENDESAAACTDGGLNTVKMGRIIDIGVATSEYIAGSAPTQPLTPGTYVIDNEMQNDEDICMVKAGHNAFLQVLDFAATNAQQIATSGTVTIATVGPHSITGSFFVVLGGPFGQTDAGTPTLSGSFNAVTCP